MKIGMKCKSCGGDNWIGFDDCSGADCLECGEFTSDKELYPEKEREIVKKTYLKKVYVYSIVFDEWDCYSYECATIKHDNCDKMIFRTIKDAEDIARSLVDEGHTVICSSSIDDWYVAFNELAIELLGDEFYM